MIKLIVRPLVLSALLATLISTAFAQGTAFTYQGRLANTGAPANGSYDLTFSLFKVSNSGVLFAGPVTNSATAVSNGLFTVTIDFGSGVFTGPAYWLEIGVRTNGTGVLTTLAPRQQILPTPYAIMANSASNLLGPLPAAQLTGTFPANQLSGTLPAGNLSGTYTNAVFFNNGADSYNGTFVGQFLGGSFFGGSFNGSFFGDGNGLLGVWHTGGNAGTSPGANNFVGTTDNQPLEFRVANTRILRFEPDPRGANAGNIIGGFPGNTVEQPGSGSDFIGSGGFPGLLNTIHSNSSGVFIGAGSLNQVGPNANDVVIAGGFGNTVREADSAIGGGTGNIIQPASDHSVIAGGGNNSILINSWNSTIGGGSGNIIQPLSDHSVIGGGGANSILPGADHSVIGGGFDNSIQTNAWDSTIAGGQNNDIEPTAQFAVIGGGVSNTNSVLYSTIGGGYHNTIQAPGTAAVISGGYQNIIQHDSYEATIAGGWMINIGSGTWQGTIGGGYINTIGDSSSQSTISGGALNNIASLSGGSTISGGLSNTIQTASISANIGGGFGNVVGPNAPNSTIPGGLQNFAGGISSFAAGYHAQATNDGSFVWADTSSTNFFNTTSSNQFLVRATGGMAINTNNPGTNALFVNGQERVTGLLRSGSETGTAEPPLTPGVVVRRINSTSTATNGIVARTDVLTLERDSTSGGFHIRYGAFTGTITIACMGINSSGTQVNFFTSFFNPGTAGITQIYLTSQNIVHFECTFGDTFDITVNHQLTQATLSRASGDTAWGGFMTSTFNQ